MAKKIIRTLLAISMLLSIASCGQVGESTVTNDSLTWQEQYDLGIRYLSEGNYEEAIIAFTAAIEIEPKQVLAYVGRGDAYVGIAKVNVEQKTEAYDNAESDYLSALSLNELMEDVYIKLADLYVDIEDLMSAADILIRGYKVTGNVELYERAENLQIKINQSKEYYGPTEGFSIPISFNVIASAGGIGEILEPFYEVSLVDGICYDRASQISGSVSTILYGDLSVNCPVAINEDSYIVRGSVYTSITDLEDAFFENWPENYVDSSDSTIESMNISSYDELFEKMSLYSTHGAGWSSTSFIESNVWILGVACYDPFGSRIGYALYEISSSSVAQVKETCMVTVNTETGELIPNEYSLN